MTDRELLEAAAKAAGIALYWAEDDPECDWVEGNYPRIPDHKVLEKWTWRIWNPLIDDGDAFRLAVRLRLHAKHFSPYEDDFDMQPAGMVEVWQEDGEDPLHIEYFKPGTDPLAATRRAIVRAAAEIGRSMT